MPRVFLSICLASWLMLAYSGSAQAITIALLPDSQEVDVNAPVHVDLTISGLTDGAAPSLSGFDLNVMYDPTILSFAGVSGVNFGDQLDLFGMGSVRSVDDSTAGTINLFELSLDLPEDLNSLQTSSFSLVSLTFDSLLERMSTLSVAVNELVDANGDPLAADVTAANINVIAATAVPEPATPLLLLSGIAILFWPRLHNRGC